MSHPGPAPALSADHPQPPSPASPAAPEGRDSRGRFTKNNRGGPGNPFARRVAGLRQALLDTVTEEDIHVVATQVLEQAKGGNLAAVKLLFAYVIGKPGGCVDPDTLDAQEWLLFQKAPVTEQALDAVLGGLPTPLACQIARTTLPAIQTQLASQIAEQFQAAPQSNPSAGGPAPVPEASSAPAPAAPAAEQAHPARLPGAARRAPQRGSAETRPPRGGAWHRLVSDVPGPPWPLPRLRAQGGWRQRRIASE